MSRLKFAKDGEDCYRIITQKMTSRDDGKRQRGRSPMTHDPLHVPMRNNITTSKKTFLHVQFLRASLPWMEIEFIYYAALP